MIWNALCPAKFRAVATNCTCSSRVAMDGQKVARGGTGPRDDFESDLDGSCSIPLDISIQANLER